MSSRPMEADIDSPKQGLGAEQLGFPVRRVPRDAPWDRLSRGWRDLCTVPSVSLAYGAFFSIAAWIILFVLSFLEATSLIPVLAAGFPLVAPLLAAGLANFTSFLAMLKMEPCRLAA